jgi:hypothetical protein
MQEHGSYTNVDSEGVRDAIQRYVQTPKDRKRGEKKRLGEDSAFLALLQRAIIANDPPLEEILRLGPDLVFRALTANRGGPEAIVSVLDRLRPHRNENTRPLCVALAFCLLSSGHPLPPEHLIEFSDAPLPPYAIETFGGAFGVIDQWLQDTTIAEYKKRKLATLIIRSLPGFGLTFEFAVSAPLTIIKRMRDAHVDPSQFPDNVRGKWLEHILRLPHQAKREVASLLAEKSDGYQTRFWDDTKLGPLPATGPLKSPSTPQTAQPSRLQSIEESSPVLDTPAARLAPQNEASDQPAIQDRPSKLPSVQEAAVREEVPNAVSWLTGLHTQLGQLLGGFHRASQLEVQLRETEEQLASSRVIADELQHRVESEVAKSLELCASLEKANGRADENRSELMKVRDAFNSLQERFAASDELIQGLRSNVAQLKNDLDEAARTRILFGEQRAVETKNSLREKITHEISGLPSLGPDLGEEHFPMVRVRFKNLLKLLAENGICGPMPGEGAR